MARVPLLAVTLLLGLGWAKAFLRTYAVAPTYFFGLGYLAATLMLAVQSGFLPFKKPPTG